MLFGHGKVSERVHLLATLLVAAGTTLSAFWILALNSWMQTPTGHEIIDGQFHVRNWLEVIFNPSFPYRLAHMLLASGITVAFLLAGVSAWQVLKGKTGGATAKVLRVGLGLAAVLVPLQIFVGDLHGLNTLEHQPQKIAAMEAVWQTERGAPLLLFAWPDEKTRSNRYEIAIPKGASLILKHEAEGEIKGLDEFAGAHPPVAPLFFAFRIMVGMGALMLAASWLGLWLYRKAGWNPARLPRPMLLALSFMSFAGWVATVAGWYVTEIGRQPFLIHGLLRTSEVTSTTPAPMIALTLTAYVVVYLALIVAYVSVIRHMASKSEEVLGQHDGAPHVVPLPGTRATQAATAGRTS
jgi:cytochrome d ubiquinol oxidase subunit I